MLELKTFKTVVASTPLISMDLIVQNDIGQILLGFRRNRPAQGFWFVPGGRILKDERFEAAFSRLSETELGERYALSQANFLGPYEHLYKDNFSDEGFSTHYVVLGYKIVWNGKLSDLPTEQHCDYLWWDAEDLLSSTEVHDNTKAYFQ
ncbi:GDP-mannose mannosyl hydrolase [Vibrio sp. VB16]|uniref:GDP-mannose mannosyl hydrolase n=1 Tax=Vibrio sp. VB16 TaxID=2785746 RepID=UPI00189E342C|nr:GDP-mannose mannosyl hydrolase [Vibrio sp. VB16]UGA57352.1 GDP-mannose mannosyl hydrolase [Vibrio sp. VB16]